MENGKTYSILDVGCGERPRGTVNLDIVEREIENFQIGNALDLPFDDNSFNTVFSSGLSFWTLHNEESKIIKSWKEAIRVAKDQVVFEYNYSKNSKTWNVRHPLYSLKLLQDEISSDISLNYSERGKFAPVIRIFEKIIGNKFTISIINNIFGKSYLAKFKLNLSGNKNIPETTLEM